MSITAAVKEVVMGLAKPVADTIDAVHTSEEEKLTLKQKFFEFQVGLYNKILDYEARIIEAQAKIITAEVQAESWLSRNWRPLTMVTFLALIVNKWTGISVVLGWPTVYISPEIEMALWDTIKLGMGGYIAGRSLEKIAPSIADAIGNMKK